MLNWKKTFAIIWMGQAVSQLTSSVLQFAIVWYLTDQTKSGSVLSFAMLAGFLPQGLLGPFIGVFIDRFNRKRIMIFSDLLIGAVSLMLVFAASDGELSVNLVLAVLFFRAIGTAFHSPTLNAVTPQLVPQDALTRCAGYTQSLQSVSLLISPAIAAVLYAAMPLGAIILLDVVGAVIASILVGCCNIPPHESCHHTTDIRLLSEAKEGLSVLFQNRPMFLLTFVTAFYTFALMPVSALFPLMCMGVFGGGSREAGIVEMVFALGFMAGSLLLGRWGGTKNKIYTIIGSFLLMSAALFGSDLLPATGYVYFVLYSALMGFSNPFYGGMITPIWQQNFSQQYLGRVLSIMGSVRFIFGPAALLLSGPLADKYGAQSWFLVAGVIVLGCAVVCIIVPEIRKCDEKSAE